MALYVGTPGTVSMNNIMSGKANNTHKTVTLSGNTTTAGGFSNPNWYRTIAFNSYGSSRSGYRSQPHLSNQRMVGGGWSAFSPGWFEYMTQANSVGFNKFPYSTGSPNRIFIPTTGLYLGIFRAYVQSVNLFYTTLGINGSINSRSVMYNYARGEMTTTNYADDVHMSVIFYAVAGDAVSPYINFWNGTGYTYGSYVLANYYFLGAG